MNLGLNTPEFIRIQEYIDDYINHDDLEYADYIQKYLDKYPEDEDNVKWYIGELTRFIKNSGFDLVAIGQAWSTRDSFVNKLGVNRCTLYT